MAKGRLGRRMAAVEESTPTRDGPVDLPFLMTIEDVCSISGRGTVVTGRVERGIVRTGEDIEIVGIKETAKTVCTGVEMFRKLLDEGEAGDLRARGGHEARERREGPVQQQLEAGDRARGEVPGRPIPRGLF